MSSLMEFNTKEKKYRSKSIMEIRSQTNAKAFKTPET